MSKYIPKGTPEYLAGLKRRKRRRRNIFNKIPEKLMDEFVQSCKTYHIKPSMALRYMVRDFLKYAEIEGLLTRYKHSHKQQRTKRIAELWDKILKKTDTGGTDDQGQL